MSGHAEHKSRRSDHLTSNSNKNEPRKCSTSASSDRIIVNANKHASVNSNSRDSLTDKKKFKEKFTTVNRSGRFPTIEGQVHCELMKEKDRGRRRTREHTDRRGLTKKLKKSRKRRRSSSCSSYSNDNSSSSRGSSGRSSSESSSSSSSSNERRKRQRKKKKLKKKIKRAEKKQCEVRRKCKKSKSREPVKKIEQDMVQTAEDKLLKDINLELADRAKAMAPMTREEWEKKQSVIRRVYDSETGRHRYVYHVITSDPHNSRIYIVFFYNFLIAD